MRSLPTRTHWSNVQHVCQGVGEIILRLRGLSTVVNAARTPELPNSIDILTLTTISPSTVLKLSTVNTLKLSIANGRAGRCY